MGCLGHGRKAAEVRPEQKWDYITLGDFKSTSCFTPFAYGYLWISLFISIAVYAVDTFTAVNILAFDRFFEKFDEEDLNFISRAVAKWIFTICIILSFLNLFYEYIRAWKIMKRGSVAECYLDNIAVRAESCRFGQGQGWRRFLVFAELTKSKKGAEYVALFTYFNFQSWIRVLICSGPRQAVNALVLYAYVTSEFVIGSDEDVQSGLLSIFDTIKSIATDDPFLALILSGMVFTLVIWVFSFLGLLFSFFFFVFFLWHWIPRSDGGLSGYCERKINKRLMKIVSVKVNKALAKEEQARLKAEMKAAKKNGEKPPEERQATLPSFMDDKLPIMPSLQRSDTAPTLPLYSSRPGSSGSSFEMGSMDQKRPMPNRNNTNVSSAPSYSSKASLMGGAAGMGYRSESPVPSLPALDMGALASTTRTMTMSSARSYGSQNQSSIARGPNSPAQYGSAYAQSPAAYSSDSLPPMPSAPSRTMANTSSNTAYNRPSPGPRQGTGTGRPPYVGGQSNFSNIEYSPNGRASPAPSNYSQASSALASPRNAYAQPSQPMRSVTGPVPPRGPQYPPARNMTAPIQPHQQHQQDYFDGGSGYGYAVDVEAQRGPRY